MFLKNKNTPTSDLYFRFAVDRYNKLTVQQYSNSAIQQLHSLTNKPIYYKQKFSNLFETSTALILIRTLDDKSYEYLKKSNKKLIYIVDDNFIEIINSDKVLDFYRHRIEEFYNKYNQYIVSRAENIVCCSEEIAKFYKSKNVTILSPYWILDSKLKNLTIRQLNDSTVKQKIRSIAWLGTRSHLADLEMIIDNIKPVFSENRNFSFNVFLRKEHVPCWLGGFPGLILHKPLKWNIYYKNIPKLNFNICLYPLENNIVNKSRSMNKIIEHCYAGAVGIYSEWFVKHKKILLPKELVSDNLSWSCKINWLVIKKNYEKTLWEHKKIALELNDKNYKTQMDFWQNIL